MSKLSIKILGGWSIEVDAILDKSPKEVFEYKLPSDNAPKTIFIPKHILRQQRIEPVNIWRSECLPEGEYDKLKELKFPFDDLPRWLFRGYVIMPCGYFRSDGERAEFIKKKILERDRNFPKVVEYYKGFHE